MNVNAFYTVHPVVNFAYFVMVILFSMFFMHPVCLAISLICSFTYSVVLKGVRAVKQNLCYMMPLFLISALMNPAFNHEGVTILTYLPSGNPLTLESIAYGVAAASMIATAICWFSCLNEVFTSDKFVYLFGRVMPSLSLILSMALRFVPKFAAQFKAVSNAQRCVGRDMYQGSLISRARHALTILSIVVTWSLENAIETADSMKSRGYGITGRTAFSIYTFGKRDKILLFIILILGAVVLAGGLSGANAFRYFPSMKGTEFSVFCVLTFVCYLALCLVPVILEVWEVRKWNALKSNI